MTSTRTFIESRRDTRPKQRLALAILCCISFTAMDGIATSPEIAATPLSCGEAASGLQGERGSMQFFKIDIPDGQARLTLKIDGESGDADIYLRHGASPTLSDYDFRPYVTGNIEEIIINAPTQGVWFVMLHGYDSYAGVNLSATCVAEHIPVNGDLPLPYRDMELALYYELYGFAASKDEIWTTELRAQALRQEGRLAFTAGNYTNAIIAWEKWHALEPDNAEPVALIGDVHLSRGDITNAIASYRKSLEVYPGQIGLVFRMARLLDNAAGQGEAARDLLNFYARLFPNHPMITLGQAEWLVRRHRYDEAKLLAQTVVDSAPEQFSPDSLQALALLHGLLTTMSERINNFAAMLEIGQRPGMASHLAWSIHDHNLLTYPESWMLLGFLDRMAVNAADRAKREVYNQLLPRTTLAREDFHAGRLSQDWLASRGENLQDDGRLVLHTDKTQTETALRLIGSDAMPSGFIDVSINHTQGFFWMYSRRGADNMVRFGFDEDDRIYLQLWLRGQLLQNHTRMWHRTHKTRNPWLRLELRGDAAFGFIDGEPAFSAPLAIPLDMGLGWWGFAPWAAEPGRAGVIASRISGGPLPVLLGLYESGDATTLAAQDIDRLKNYMRGLSAMAPAWYTQQADSSVTPDGNTEKYNDLRLLCRYYRVRLLPLLRVHDLISLDIPGLLARARKDRVDGFTLLVERMPDPQWIAATERMLLDTPLSLHILLLDANSRKAYLREICAFVGLFAGPRRIQIIPILEGDALPSMNDHEPLNTELPHALLRL
ncbi:MAG: pre-peptidase C-terminal domain-containing protein [Kiritimatiellia bacterium]